MGIQAGQKAATGPFLPAWIPDTSPGKAVSSDR